MSYKLAPFNPNTPYDNQVSTELNYANDNFTILGQAFNNDPSSNPVLRSTFVDNSPPNNPLKGTAWLDTSGVFPIIKVYDGSTWQYSSFKRVDLSNIYNDYTLQVGEEAIISFNNASSVPLHIATTSTAVYWLYCSVGGCNLNPNNTTYSNSFYWVDWGVNYDGSNATSQYNGSSGNNFSLGNASGIGFIISYVDIGSAKTITQHSVSFSDQPYSIRHIACHWKNPSSWTSLGTISFPNSSSGFILIRRLI